MTYWGCSTAWARVQPARVQWFKTYARLVFRLPRSDINLSFRVSLAASRWRPCLHAHSGVERRCGGRRAEGGTVPLMATHHSHVQSSSMSLLQHI